jgi:hypothetical protein
MRCADRDRVSGWSVSCLSVWLSAGSLFLRGEPSAVSFFLGSVVAGRLGDLGDRVGFGQAELFGPALGATSHVHIAQDHRNFMLWLGSV